MELEEDPAKSLNIRKCASHLGFSLGGESGCGALNDRDTQCLFTEKELGELLRRVREELVPDLEGICDGWESNYSDGEDPDEFFQPLIELFVALQDHFAEDQKILDIIEHEESQLSQWIADNC